MTMQIDVLFDASTLDVTDTGTFILGRISKPTCFQLEPFAATALSVCVTLLEAATRR
jgi:hypothetical protein